MRVFNELVGVTRVSNSAHALNLTKEYFYQFLHESVAEIYSHPALLKIKFLGVSEERPAPSDEHLIPVIQTQIQKLSEKYEWFSVQDNIDAAKKKIAMAQVIKIFTDMLK